MNREALKSMYALEFPKWSGTHPRIVMASLCTKCFTSPILTLTWGDGVNLELVYMHKFIEFDRAPCRKGFQHLTDFGWGGIPACICAGVHDCLHTHTRKTFPLHCFSHLSLSLNCSCVSGSCMAGSVWHPQAITCFCKLIISQASFPL
jgi:hypothetical protein